MFRCTLFTAGLCTALLISLVSSSHAADVDQLLRLEQWRQAPAANAVPAVAPEEPAGEAPFVEEPGVLYAYG